MQKESKLIYFFNDREMGSDALTLDNVDVSAEFFLHSFINRFETPIFDVKYNISRDASFKEKGEEIDNIDIDMELVFKSMSGVKTSAQCTVRVREGRFIEPSIMKYNGSMRLISQDVFDEIERETTFHYPIRNLFSIFPNKDTTYDWISNNEDFWRA